MSNHVKRLNEQLRDRRKLLGGRLKNGAASNLRRTLALVYAAALLWFVPLVLSAVEIDGAGATFPFPIYSEWFIAYYKLHPSVHISYEGIGSGGGIRRLMEDSVDFGASDAPLNDAQLERYAEKHGSGVLHFPTVVGADVPIYNVPGIGADLKFTPEALSGIFLGKITKWNDLEIAKANPKANLPASEILVVHRLDGSGTTYVWTDYLSKVSDEWKSTVGTGTSVTWPVGVAGQGNEGVAALVKSTVNSIGYVELAFALKGNLPYGRVRNSAGVFEKADLASASAAAAGAAQQMPEDFRASITNAPGKSVYPIASFTWLLIPSNIKNQAKRRATVDLLKWILTDGQSVVEALGYAPLPPRVVVKEAAAVAKIK